MFDATLPSESLAALPMAAPGMRGEAKIAFKRVEGGTGLAALRQVAPLRIQLPATPAGAPLLAVLMTTSGGLVGGDRLDLLIEAGAGSQALVMAQAAEKVYRSDGPMVRQTTTIRVGAGARLDFLPQETILFEGARLEREMSVEVAAGGRLMAGEMLVFGRLARGERFTRGHLADRWFVRREERLVWADSLILDEDPGAMIEHPAGLAGAVAAASLILVSDEAPERLDLLRSCLPDRAAASLVGGVLVARFLSGELKSLRRDFIRAWTILGAADGLAGTPPRFWHA